MAGFVPGYVAAQLRLLFRVRSSLFWVIAFPFMMVLISSGIWGSPAVPKVHLAVLNLDGNGSVAKGLLHGLREAPVVGDIVFAKNMSELRRLLSGRVGLVIPRGFSANVTSGKQGMLVILYPATGESWVTTSVSILRGVLNRFEDKMRMQMLRYALPYVPAMYRPYLETLANPLVVKEEEVRLKHTVTSATIKGWMAVSMIIVEALFIGLSVGATSFHEERRLGLLRYMLSSPVKGWQMLAARLATALLYVAVAAAASLAAGAATGASVEATPGGALVAAVMVALATLVTTSMGFVISWLVGRGEAAQATAMAIAFPLMFLGGIWVPAWMLPPPLQRLAEVFPVSRMADAVRAVLVYGKTPLDALATYTPPQILGLSLLLVALGAAAYRRMLERLVEGA